MDNRENWTLLVAKSSVKMIIDDNNDYDDNYDVDVDDDDNDDEKQ